MFIIVAKYLNDFTKFKEKNLSTVVPLVVINEKIKYTSDSQIGSKS